MTGGTTGADRGVPKVRVLLGTERFSTSTSWTPKPSMPDSSA